jgi:hypothetical protein
MANVVLRQAWIAELIKGFDNLNEDFLANVPDFSQLVGNNVINMNEIGADPAVLIDNHVYPLAATQREDEGRIIPLRKMETEVTIITDDELYALPYDKKGSVLDRHLIALRKEALKISLHSIAPAANTNDTPVIETTGTENVDGNKALTPKDLVTFRRKLDDLGVPDGCSLVLCNEHIQDLRNVDEVFRNRFTDQVTGKALGYMGFNVFHNMYTVPYLAKEKVAFGAARLDTHKSASIAFYAPNAMKARGSVKMYYSDAAINPRYKQSEVSFTMYFLAAVKKATGFGAIVSVAN